MQVLTNLNGNLHLIENTAKPAKRFSTILNLGKITFTKTE